MRLPNLIRYGLLAGVAYTANANRRHYRMTTTWLPHLAMNSFALLLPDLLRHALPAARVDRCDAAGPPQELVRVTAATLQALVCENRAYVGYVAPLAVGYLLSHPEFNIYKGEWGEMQLAGFGFDALPHAAAGFALSAAVIDALREAAYHAAGGGSAASAFRWAAAHSRVLAFVALALVTAVWEVGEYRVHKHELAQRGDVSQINMQWSFDDSLTDVIANLAGWLAAAWWRATPEGVWPVPNTAR